MGAWDGIILPKNVFPSTNSRHIDRREDRDIVYVPRGTKDDRCYRTFPIPKFDARNVDLIANAVFVLAFVTDSFKICLRPLLRMMMRQILHVIRLFPFWETTPKIVRY